MKRLDVQDPDSWAMLLFGILTFLVLVLVLHNLADIIVNPHPAMTQ